MPLYSLSVCYQSFAGLLDRGKALKKAMRKRSKSVVKDASQNDDIESISDTNLPPPELSFTHVVYEVVSKCLRRHSKRPKSAEVKIITYAI